MFIIILFFFCYVIYWLLRGYQTPITSKKYIENKTLQENESINNIKNK